MESCGTNPGSLPGRSLNKWDPWWVAKEETRPAGQCGFFLGCDDNVGGGRKKGWGRVPELYFLLPPTLSPFPRPQLPFSSGILGFLPTCSLRPLEGSMSIPSKSPANTQKAGSSPMCVCDVAIRAGLHLLPTLKFWQIRGGVGAGLCENRGLLVFPQRKQEISQTWR